QPDPTLGSTEPDEETNPYTFETQFTPFGAGVRHILLSRYSTSAQQHIPYPLQHRLLFDYVQVGGESVPTYRYPMAAYSVTVNGTRVYLYHQRWEVIEETETSAVFQITLVNEDAQPVLRITRTWEIAPDDYNIRLAQRLQNLSDQPLRVVFSQQGPGEMNQDPGYIGDQRHVVVGYLRPRRNQPEVKDPTTEDFYLSRRNIMGAESPVIWPPVEGDPNRDLLWVAMTNRYFAASLFVPVRENEQGRLAVRPLEPLFPTVIRDTWGAPDDPSLALMLDSAPLELTANSAATLRTKLYAGPKKPALLKSEPHYVALNMGQLIRYNLGGPCAILTFAWLGEGLLAFLTFIHDVFMDWGLAIILLVAVVRLVLHPLTKRSQINMMKMGKQMQALQPEIERLKKKHGDDQKKLQQEMLKLYQEKGVNPFAMGLGCLPMFVQMPIWIALYAMLYFAIELRHSPAFWGVFQWISNDAWPFLADLSDQDRFIPL
ncbi:MAG: YidC/Oxa1 family insertase periplasmic-domain containing protein, partial [Phycisphaeraceae bacterium]